MATTKNEAVKAGPELIPIYIHRLPDDDGAVEIDQRITVTVNGVNRILPRGERIEVSLAEYEILRNSCRFDIL